jgi:ABC-type antimicrobial peptide transport system permease subunit
MDANVAPFDLAPLESALAATTARERFTVLLLAAFSLLALTLATVGIYGVVAYTVGRRRQEIALRLVLGAPTGEVFQRIVGGMLMRAAVGVTAGLAIALMMARLMQPLVFETSVRDAATYATVAGILLWAALIGAAAPAARAAGLNAAAALREE